MSLPAEEQNEIFTKERILPLVSALLTASEKKRIQCKNNDSRNAMIDREFEIAAVFMEKGIMKCSDRVGIPYGERIKRDAWELLRILNYEATKGKRFGFNPLICEIKNGDWREKVPPLLPIRAQK